MRAVDIELLSNLSRPTLDPSGERAVVAVTRPHLAADAYVGQLWEVALDGSVPPRRLTRGFRDGSPQFSPDGSALAFLRAAPGEPTQLAVIDARGGEPIIVTDAELGVDAFQWSPDGSTLAFRARVPELGRYGSVDGMSAGAEAPRRLTTLRYRSNGVGYTGDRPARVHLVPSPDLQGAPFVAPIAERDGSTQEASPVTPGVGLSSPEGDAGAFAFSPDGTELWVVEALHDERDIDLNSGVYAYGIEAGESARRVILSPTAGLSIGDLVVGFDDVPVVLASETGESGRDFVARNTGLFVIEGDSATRLTDAETIDLGEVGSRITRAGSDAVLVQNRTCGRVELVSVTRTGDVTPVLDGAVEVTGAAAGNVVVASVQSAESFGDLVVIDGAGHRRLTDFSADIRAAGIVRPREITVPTRDGSTVHGWIVRPEGDGPHPALLMIHGGPFSQYSVHLFDEAQVLADAGYAVVFCNPRGSAGYGEAHGRVIRQKMGSVDLTDVLDFLDGALALDSALDATRLGILGGSYGGYLTAWAIAHDHRFAAAIVERGFLDPEYFVGTSDIGDFFADEYTGTDAALQRSQSPQAVVDQVTTPTFVIHSENDLRCPLGQAERYYASLKRNGVETELLVFPGEDHELSRSGRPRHRVERFEAIIEWWNRYLPV
ncbi:S9 family peptidase [Agromyces atrinae]|uniref:S9 family peptidase n=1 Tax=Agromyces atrinae TaxID=592376 RepID=UPI001F582AEB|nr:S9 family peptidase [Agromyces atrinae]MCI2958653.1 S9 family peptidase [Agromyces atrinae]